MDWEDLEPPISDNNLTDSSTSVVKFKPANLKDETIFIGQICILLPFAFSNSTLSYKGCLHKHNTLDIANFVSKGKCETQELNCIR